MKRQIMVQFYFVNEVLILHIVKSFEMEYFLHLQNESNYLFGSLVMWRVIILLFYDTFLYAIEKFSG